MRVVARLSENSWVSQGPLLIVSPKREPVAWARVARDFTPWLFVPCFWVVNCMSGLVYSILSMKHMNMLVRLDCIGWNVELTWVWHELSMRWLVIKVTWYWYEIQILYSWFGKDEFVWIQHWIWMRIGYKDWHEIYVHDKYYLIDWVWLVSGKYVILWVSRWDLMVVLKWSWRNSMTLISGSS